MWLLIDIVYLLLLPAILVKALFSRLNGHPKRKDFLARFGFGSTLESCSNRVLIHAVSVGEINAIRQLVEILQKDSFNVVVSTTTDTGFEQAKKLFGDKHDVVRFPLDLSSSVRRFLDRVKPNIIVLVELEVWPNTVELASKRKIPVVVINGRLSERSFKRYKLVKPFLRKTFGQLRSIGMQNKVYANRVNSLGARKVTIQGNMKWDSALIRNTVEGANELALEMGIDLQKPLVVAGSTAPDEHLMLKKALPDGAQLLCAPRRPEWFDQAESVFGNCNRRTVERRVKTRYFLLDTIGELEKAYALADIAVIGRSFVPLHGSDPTQSVALGKPTIIGPNVSDFEEVVDKFLKGGGILQVGSNELPETLRSLVECKETQEKIANAGRQVIQENQGATQKYASLIKEVVCDA